MENIMIHTRSMLSIMRPLVDQVELFSSYAYNSDSEEFQKPEVEEICSSLLQLHDPYFSKDVVLLKVALRDFYEAVDLMKQQKRISDRNKHTFQMLTWNVYKFLVKRDSVTAQNIRTVIAKCNDHFTKFVNNDIDKEGVQHLQAFVENAIECLKQVRGRTEDLITKKHRQQLLLCVRQIAKCVPLLVTTLNKPTCADQTQVFTCIK